jgi:hypothetical protein
LFQGWDEETEGACGSVTAMSRDGRRTGWGEISGGGVCWTTIQLKAINAGAGFVHVTKDGEIRTGHTLRGSQRVGPQTRRHMLGDD